VRLAEALLRAGELDEAAATLAPWLARPLDGPRGAIFCRDALAAVAAAPWGERLAPAALDTLRRWAAALQPTPAATAPPRTAPLDPLLSPRELEVLERIARGESNKLIARAFDLSPYTA